VRTWRPLGVRTQLLGAMVGLALASVAVTAIIVNRAVDSELRDFSQRDLRFSATNAAEMAASVYRETGGWTERSVTALRTIAALRGDDVVVLGADGRPVGGWSPATATQSSDGERAPIMVGGTRIGTIVASHTRPGGVSTAGERLDHHLRARTGGLLLEAGLGAAALAVLLALLIALRLARPLQRLTEVASRIGAGELQTRAAGSGGGREITRLAQTMDRLAEALRHQDELRRETAADVKHELRGALVGVVSRLEAVRHGMVDDEQVALAQIQRDAHRVRRLVDDVDRLAEAQRSGLLVRKRAIDLDVIVDTCVAGYADRCRALSIELTSAVRRAAVVGDPERLAQVVDNLLSNALRYTDPGGRVAVALDARGDEIAFTVTDSGIGIAPEELGLIFDRFWRSREARERTGDGSGVGLALVSELVDVHDGRIVVDSEPGRGTTVCVLLPMIGPSATPARRPSPVTERWRWRAEVGASARPDAPAVR